MPLAAARSSREQFGGQSWDGDYGGTERRAEKRGRTTGGLPFGASNASQDEKILPYDLVTRLRLVSGAV